MKTKFFILTIVLLYIGLLIPKQSMLMADEVFSNTLPSENYYNQNKGYFNSGGAMSSDLSISSILRQPSPRAGDWWDDDDEKPVTPPKEDETEGNEVGGPIGEITPAVILVMLVFYTLYRRATTSRRRTL